MFHYFRWVFAFAAHIYMCTNAAKFVRFIDLTSFYLSINWNQMGDMQTFCSNTQVNIHLIGERKKLAIKSIQTRNGFKYLMTAYTESVTQSVCKYHVAQTVLDYVYFSFFLSFFSIRWRSFSIEKKKSIDTLIKIQFEINAIQR